MPWVPVLRTDELACDGRVDTPHGRVRCLQAPEGIVTVHLPGFMVKAAFCDSCDVEDAVERASRKWPCRSKDGSEINSPMAAVMQAFPWLIEGGENFQPDGLG